MIWLQFVSWQRLKILVPCQEITIVYLFRLLGNALIILGSLCGVFISLVAIIGLLLILGVIFMPIWRRYLLPRFCKIGVKYFHDALVEWENHSSNIYGRARHGNDWMSLQ